MSACAIAPVLARSLRPARSGRHLAALFLAAIVVNQATYAPCAAQQVVTLTGDPWPPYVVGELGREAQSGIAVELARRIFERIDGWQASFPLIPWNRALREVESGSKDGIVILLKTPDRERYMAYTEPLFTARALMWYSVKRFPSGFDWKELADLAPYRLGITRGYSYGDEIDGAIEVGRLRVTEVPTAERLFAMLARDRLDLALAGDSVGYTLAREQAHVNPIVPASKATGTDVYHIAISKKSEARHLVPAIDRILSELRRDGVVDRLINGN
jgi:uncharacterized protein (TIGR02285 family)